MHISSTHISNKLFSPSTASAPAHKRTAETRLAAAAVKGGSTTDANPACELHAMLGQQASEARSHGWRLPVWLGTCARRPRAIAWHACCWHEGSAGQASAPASQPASHQPASQPALQSSFIKIQFASPFVFESDQVFRRSSLQAIPLFTISFTEGVRELTSELATFQAPARDPGALEFRCGDELCYRACFVSDLDAFSFAASITHFLTQTLARALAPFPSAHCTVDLRRDVCGRRSLGRLPRLSASSLRRMRSCWSDSLRSATDYDLPMPVLEDRSPSGAWVCPSSSSMLDSALSVTRE